MAEQAATQVAPKKRIAKPGTRRMTIAVSDTEYSKLVTFAAGEMREPNNMLSYILRGKISDLLDAFADAP
jgi:hypothetical protein